MGFEPGLSEHRALSIHGETILGFSGAGRICSGRGKMSPRALVVGEVNRSAEGRGRGR